MNCDSLVRVSASECSRRIDPAAVQPNGMKKGDWTVLSNHGRMLVYLAGYPQCTTQLIAQRMDLSIRAVQKIIDTLEHDGYLTRRRAGRCNSYEVHSEMPMRHSLESGTSVGRIIDALGPGPREDVTQFGGSDIEQAGRVSDSQQF
jgi:biotin operon repressor